MWWVLSLVVAAGAVAAAATTTNGRTNDVEVVSSALWVTPKASNSSRERRSGGEQGAWRTPREHQFVTRERASGLSRLSRLLEPEPSASRNYIDERFYYDDVRRSGGDEEPFERREPAAGPQRPRKRIIYYATLPEIVRRPGEWTPPRPIYGGGFPHNFRDNDVFPRPQHGFFSDSGTRVSSSIIGFSDKRDPPPGLPYRDDLSVPRFTIIDAEPPYNYAPPPHYDGRFNFDRNPFGNDRPYNAPYASRFDRRPPQHSSDIPLPAVPFTVIRKPLDVRPLDPESSVEYTTQGTPSPSTSTLSPSTSTSGPQLSGYERSFKV